MKYILIGIVLGLMSCSNNDSEIDKDLKELQRQNQINTHAIAVMNCEEGVLFTVGEFVKLLKGKAKHGQLEKIWAQCEALP